MSLLGNDAAADKAPLRETLESLHGRLDEHYSALARSRAAADAPLPVFALEHGLAEGDLRVLEVTVQSWTRRWRPPRQAWLPFVAFATEVGYRYEGDEYWPTLEARAPGWERLIGRQWLKARFKEFAKSYGGAVPRGRWASHFSIICWPITHAVLPTDLQRQLARLLYESRGLLTSDLLADPTSLGEELAARSFGASKRFQQFAENTELLGHVSASLLAESSTSSSLLSATLERIVEDLTRERQARRWLGDARRTADRVRLGGVSRGGGTSGQARQAASRAASVTDPPAMSLHPTQDGWQLRFRVPDLTPLIARHPHLGEQLSSLRCRIAGASERPKPRGWLRYAGQQATIDSWPGPDVPLFELERAQVHENRLLGEEVRTPASAAWLFRIGAEGSARLVRSGVVHPGERYVLIGPQRIEQTASWIHEVDTACGGAYAALVEVPAEIDDECRRILADLSLAVQTWVRVEPVGLVPAAWDGDGYSEWITGDQPMLAFTASHLVESCVIAVNGVDQGHVRMDETAGSAVVQLSGLTPGTHLVDFSFLSTPGSPAVPPGRLVARVREPERTRSSGSFREPVRIRVSPPAASMEDVWDGKASVWIDGPSNHRTNLRASLRSGSDDSEVTTHSAQIHLPASDDQWRDWFESNFRSLRAFQDTYDDASHLDIVVGDDELGRARVSFERSVEPLRWGFRRRRDRRSLRLLESADTGSRVAIEYHSFAKPDVPQSVDSSGADSLATPDGGLFVARLDSYVASALLPVEVRDLQDLRSAGTAPRLDTRDRSVANVIHLAQCISLWSGARSPGDLLAEMSRRNVLLALRCCLGGLIGGKLWQSIESRYSEGKPVDLDTCERGLAKPHDWSWFRQQVIQLAERWTDSEPPVEDFATIFGQRTVSNGRSPIESSSGRSLHGRYPGSRVNEDGVWMAEFLLRLASAPDPLGDIEDRRAAAAIGELMENPLGFRAARLLAIDAEQDGRPWQWQY